MSFVDLVDDILDRFFYRQINYWRRRWETESELCDSGENIDYCLTRLCIVDNNESEYLRWRNACYQSLYRLDAFAYKNCSSIKFLLKHHVDCANDVAEHHVADVYTDLISDNWTYEEIRQMADYIALLDCFEEYQLFLATNLRDRGYVDREEAYVVIDKAVERYKSRTTLRVAVQSTDGQFVPTHYSLDANLAQYAEYKYRVRNY